MDKTLLRACLVEEGPLSRDRWSERVVLEEVVALAEDLFDVSAASASAFLEVSPSVLPFLSSEEGAEWELPLRGMFSAPLKDPRTLQEEVRSGPTTLSEGSFRSFKGWLEQGLRMAKRCPEAAAQYFRSTPAFLKHEAVFQMTQWSEWALRILASGETSQEAAIAFLRSSPEMLELMPLREFGKWHGPGLQIAEHSGHLASIYYAFTPKRFGVLERPERFVALELITILTEDDPEKAIEFLQRCLGLLADLSPAVRGAVLEATQRISGKRAAHIAGVFDEIVSATLPLSYPTQKSVVEQGLAIGETSPAASRAHFRNLDLLLRELPDAFLPNWVEQGLAVLANDEEDGVTYFSLASDESRAELSRWQGAVFLEDHRHVLALLAHALAGRELRVKSTEQLENPRDSELSQLPTSDGQTIYLPPFQVSEGTREENFRKYKVATAHQAGYVEFGTFDGGLSAILKSLESLPLRDLALDIFTVLEDGRVDHNLGKEYRGLKVDLGRVWAGEIAKRPAPQELPLLEALVEVLLRLTVGHWNEKSVSGTLSGHVSFLSGALCGFFERSRGVRDCFLKTLVIYDYLSQLSTSNSYSASPPVSFRGILDLDLVPDSGQWDTPLDGARPEEIETITVPLDELRGLADAVEDPSVLEIVKGLEVSSQGLFITDGEGVTADGPGDDPEDGEHQGLPPALMSSRAASAFERGPFYYDEWDHLQKSYRRRWCCLREKTVKPVAAGRVDQIYADYGDIIRRVKKQFQRIRPEVFDILRRVEWGDEIDLMEIIQGVVDRKAGAAPSERVFSRKERRIRKISTLLLVDMSASTDEFVPCPSDSGPVSGESHLPPGARVPANAEGEKKIIDIEIESLVVVMEALQALDDEYAIFGFSGYGRDCVDFYRIKDFCDPYSAALKNRIGGIQPKRSTRMGPAIRHATEKMKTTESDQRLLILLSDGFPQDHDYGEDRRSTEYGLYDTRMALLEAKREGIRPFCITVDQSGNDYLRKMCDPRNYLVIHDIYSLPETLPKVVESLMAD